MSEQQPQTLWLIPHTHWDREWYEPHDVFRARLVVMLDELLDVLEGEPEYKFTLDGQSAALDDYLEIRPERLDQVRAAVSRGQLAVGPFQILLDEFCCDGETIVRNLEHGIRAARRVGTEMRVGYLPDMFGHAAQMPQILGGFGIRDASLWRGVPAFVDEHAFVWEAVDGSQVRVEYQWDGYGNALKLFEPLEKLPELVADYLIDNASWFRGDDVAGMFGTDHMAPRPDLVGILRQYREQCHPTGLRVATIEEVVASRDHTPAALKKLPKVRGELRSHARGNLLPGVFSIRTNIKAAMARAERALTTAERVDAWAGGMSRTALLERGWGWSSSPRRMIPSRAVARTAPPPRWNHASTSRRTPLEEPSTSHCRPWVNAPTWELRRSSTRADGPGRSRRSWWWRWRPTQHRRGCRCSRSCPR